MFSIRSRAFSASILLAVLSHRAAATTYTVDAAGGAGSQFTDIPAAMAIAVPGDVILVRAGTYSSFTVSMGLTIHGISDYARVNGAVTVAGLPAGERVVLSDVHPTQLTLADCSGPIYVEALSSQHVAISHCVDVRFSGVFVEPTQGPAVCAVEVEDSRVQLNDCFFSGSSSPSAPAPFQDGGDAVHARDQSRIYAAFSTFRGGNSGLSFDAALTSGSGGSGLVLEGASSVRLHSGAVHVGIPGVCIAPQCFDCSFDGAVGACIVLLQGSTADFSSSTVFSSLQLPSPPSCNPVPVPQVVGPGATQVSPADPSLGAASSFGPLGHALTYYVQGPPGSTVVLWLGRALIVNPTPPIALEQLVSHDRSFSLGVIPSSGTISFKLPISRELPDSGLFGAQADVQLPSGEIRRTHSVQTTRLGL